MKIMKNFAFAVLVACVPLAALANSVDFSNLDGNITSSGGDSLTLSGSTLLGVSGLGLYDCPSPSCSGSVTFTTGSQGFSGSLTGPGGATWTGGAGSSFTITGNAGGPGGAFTFTGSFSSATWTPSGSGATQFWVFTAVISNGTLTDSLGTFTMIPGGTVSLTTMGGPNSSGVWTDSSGDTTITVPAGAVPQPVPELGTLTLLGSGLVSLGIFARRRLSQRATASK